MSLHRVLETPATERAGHTAVIDAAGGGRMDYGRLDVLSDRIRDRLYAIGVRRGDRVGVYLTKSSDAIAAFFGILKCGAAYVPVDPTAPASRGAYIHDDCGVKAVVIEKAFVDAYSTEIDKLGGVPFLIVLDGTGEGKGLQAALDRMDLDGPAPPVPTVDSDPDDLAYILYTSGSTGTPKGVMLSHLNAMAFVDWCSEVFEPQPDDVFSSHAPFHFDLSIFDIYVSMKHGATLVVLTAEMGKNPEAMSSVIAEHGISIWYSAPSTLTIMSQFGKIPDYDLGSLRLVLFAGEVMPVVHLRSFKSKVPGPRYFNLYGPTETNVCTWYEIPAVVPDDRVEPYPIGVTCSQLESRVVDSNGDAAGEGAEGELCIAGPNVMHGYWGRPDLTEKSFLPPGPDGRRWYKTGDIVAAMPDGNFRYLGRRDRMVKRRGNRVELGEIEACLYRHPAVQEAAVVAVTNDVGEVVIRAHLSTVGNEKKSLIEMKSFCSKHLPLYMIPDSFTYHSSLPKTSTDKIDLQALQKAS